MEISPLSDALGASVTGVDIGKINQAQFAEIQRAFLAQQLLVFREQRLDA